MSFLRHKWASKVNKKGELLPQIDFRQPSSLSLMSCSPAELISVFIDLTNIKSIVYIDTHVEKYLPTFLSIRENKLKNTNFFVHYV